MIVPGLYNLVNCQHYHHQLSILIHSDIHQRLHTNIIQYTKFHSGSMYIPSNTFVYDCSHNISLSCFHLSLDILYVHVYILLFKKTTFTSSSSKDVSCVFDIICSQLIEVLVVNFIFPFLIIEVSNEMSGFKKSNSCIISRYL